MTFSNSCTEKLKVKWLFRAEIALSQHLRTASIRDLKSGCSFYRVSSARRGQVVRMRLKRIVNDPLFKEFLLYYIVIQWNTILSALISWFVTSSQLKKLYPIDKRQLLSSWMFNTTKRINNEPLPRVFRNFKNIYPNFPKNFPKTYLK